MDHWRQQAQDRICITVTWKCHFQVRLDRAHKPTGPLTPSALAQPASADVPAVRSPKLPGNYRYAPLQPNSLAAHIEHSDCPCGWEVELVAQGIVLQGDCSPMLIRLRARLTSPFGYPARMSSARRTAP